MMQQGLTTHANDEVPAHVDPTHPDRRARGGRESWRNPATLAHVPSARPHDEAGRPCRPRRARGLLCC